MTIKDDIDYQLKKYKGSTVLERSSFAYSLLCRFDQLREHIKRGEDVTGFQIYDFIPPSLRKIAEDYISGKTPVHQTLKAISRTKNRATIYLRGQGCNPYLAE